MITDQPLIFCDYRFDSCNRYQYPDTLNFENTQTNNNQFDYVYDYQIKNQCLDELSTPRQRSIITDSKLVFNIIKDYELVQLLNKIIITQERDTQNDYIPTVKIYDCRWPYEYNAGHIKSSINMYDGNIFKNELINNQEYKIDFAIFYCEYSQVRARKMYQYCDYLLKNEIFNTQIDQILLLEEGFSNFYNKYPKYVDGYYLQERILFTSKQI